MSGECDCGSAGVSSTRRESAYDMLRVERALDVVLAQAAPLAAETRPAHLAVGHVLAEPVYSTVRLSVSLSRLPHLLASDLE